MDCNVEFIIALVTARMVARLVALGILTEDLLLVFLDVRFNIPYL